MISAQLGDVFEKKCDLLVLPCDSAGGVSSFVMGALDRRRLPSRVGLIPFGGVHFRNVHYENAMVIGYASTVDYETVTSDITAIRRICDQLQKFCADNKILTVNLPLLGAGSGGIAAADSYLAMKRALQGDPDTLYRVYCFSEESYSEVRAVAQVGLQQSIARPRVFISYTGVDPLNAKLAKDLALGLRANGINARLDAYHLRPGFDLPQWMTNEVIQADRVILLCDAHYMKKADVRMGGVGWETMIIQGDMLSQGDNKQKYVAISLEDVVENALPIYVRSKFCLSWGRSGISDEKLRELTLLLFDCDDEPCLGPVPDYILQRRRTLVLS